MKKSLLSLPFIIFVLPAAPLHACNLAVCATSTFEVTIPDDQVPLYNGSTVRPSGTDTVVSFGPKLPAKPTAPVVVPYDFTIGTFAPLGEVTITPTEQPGTGSGTNFQLVGTDPDNKMSYTIDYIDCENTDHSLSVGQATTIPYSGAGMANTYGSGANAPCYPYPLTNGHGGGTPGHGAGQLIFTLPATSHIPDSYTDTVTLTLTTT